MFTCVKEAVAAARDAYEQLSRRTLEDRKRIIGHIRRISIDQCVELGTMEMEETKIGRLEHKIEKLKTLGERTPGVEFMRSEVYSGDHGLAVIEHAPFGVIGAITPVTHSLPTLTGNAVNMIAAGNTLVVNPHPSGKRVATEGVRRFNEAIYQDLGIDNLICIIAEPTLDSAAAIFKHRDVALICVTGGAGGGPRGTQQRQAGDRGRAGQSARGRGRNSRPGPRGPSHHSRRFLRQQPAVHRRERSVRRRRGVRQDDGRHGAGRRRAPDRQRSRSLHRGRHRESRRRGTPARRSVREFLGQGRRRAGTARRHASCPPETELIFGETDESNPFVPVEQMMPFVPFVRCRDVDEAIEKASNAEHGFRHTALIHSNNVHNMTRMGQIMDATLFVKNGPCMSALGLGGEGYISFSIAGPTGEGVTTPLTFTRERRCSMIEDLRILGKPRSRTVTCQQLTTNHSPHHYDC